MSTFTRFFRGLISKRKRISGEYLEYLLIILLFGLATVAAYICFKNTTVTKLGWEKQNAITKQNQTREAVPTKETLWYQFKVYPGAATGYDIDGDSQAQTINGIYVELQLPASDKIPEHYLDLNSGMAFRPEPESLVRRDQEMVEIHLISTCPIPVNVHKDPPERILNSSDRLFLAY